MWNACLPRVIPIVVLETTKPYLSSSAWLQIQALQCVLGTLAGGEVAAILVALRLYLGWVYVGNRLFSATVECEWDKKNREKPGGSR